MPDEDSPRDPEVDEVSARLNDGLKTCRSMVASYKALLTSDQKTVEAADTRQPSPEQVDDPPA